MAPVSTLRPPRSVTSTGVKSGEQESRVRGRDHFTFAGIKVIIRHGEPLMGMSVTECPPSSETGIFSYPPSHVKPFKCFATTNKSQIGHKTRTQTPAQFTPSSLILNLP